MSSILVAWELGSGLGHVGRLRPIVASLVDRGHAVTVVGRDVMLCEQTLGSLGAYILPAPVLPDANPRIRVPCTFADVLHDSGYRHAENLSAAVCAWRHVFELVRPEAILADHSPTALLAGRGFEAPTAVVGTGFLCPPDVTPLPSLRRSVPQPAWAAEIENLVLDNMNAALRRIDAAGLQRVTQLYGEVDRQFLLTLPEIDHYSERKMAEYVRPICEVVGEPPSWPRGGGPKVFVYLKHHPAMLAVLEALVPLEFSLLCFAPKIDSALANRLSAENVRFVQQPQDIRDAAWQCDAAITNGGHGGTCEFLLAGKPVLIVPMSLEQQVTGQRVADLGVGLISSIKQPAECLDGLRQIASAPAYSEAARTFAARYGHLNQEDSLSSIIAGIERLLSE